MLEDAILHSNFFGDRDAARRRRWPARWSARWPGAAPEDLAILNKYWHGVVEPRSKEDGGEWADFLEGGREAIATLS